MPEICPLLFEIDFRYLIFWTVVIYPHKTKALRKCGFFTQQIESNVFADKFFPVTTDTVVATYFLGSTQIHLKRRGMLLRK